MVGTSGSVDPVLTLFEPAGLPMATDDNSGGDGAALLRSIRLPVDGSYIIQALGGGTGSYHISLAADAPAPGQPTGTATPPLGTSTPASASEQLSDHVPFADQIDEAGGFRRYFIAAQAGDILTVSLRPLSNLQPRVEVYTPEGELLVWATLSRDGTATLSGFGVPETGTYTLYVNATGNTSGAYTLAYGMGDTTVDNLRGDLAAETPAAGSQLDAVRDQWTLPLNTGDQVDVEANGAALLVVAPDGSQIAGGQNAVQFGATQSGDYRVYASGGAYTLVLRYLVAAPTEPAPLLILSADDPLPPDTYLDYPFQGTAGQRIHVLVEALTDGFDPVAALLDADGNPIASGDDSPNSLNPDFEVVLPADGTYRLRVNGYGEVGGSVRVRVELLS